MAVPGGQVVFDLFLKIGFDAFHLTRAHGVRLPGGRALFSDCDTGLSAEAVLASAGWPQRNSRSRCRAWRRHERLARGSRDRRRAGRKSVNRGRINQFTTSRRMTVFARRRRPESTYSCGCRSRPRTSQVGGRARLQGLLRERPESAPYPRFHCEDGVTLRARSTHSPESIWTGEGREAGRATERFTGLDHDLARKLRQYLIDRKSDGISPRLRAIITRRRQHIRPLNQERADSSAGTRHLQRASRRRRRRRRRLARLRPATTTTGLAFERIAAPAASRTFGLPMSIDQVVQFAATKLSRPARPAGPDGHGWPRSGEIPLRSNLECLRTRYIQQTTKTLVYTARYVSAS